MHPSESASPLKTLIPPSIDNSRQLRAAMKAFQTLF